MKCASAFAAMIVIVLGTPAIALAGTVGSGPGGPGRVQIMCSVPGKQVVRLKQVQVVRLKHRGRRRAVQFSWVGKPPRGRLLPFCPLPRACPPGVLTFDMGSGSSTLTEVAGPVLAPPAEFRYQGEDYTIMSVNPGDGSFTVFRDGALFVNNGPAITRGVGFMGCTTVRSVKI